MTYGLEEKKIHDVQEAFQSGDLTSLQLTTMYIERIANYDKSGIHLNAITELNPDAFDIAAFLDRERKEGTIRGPLHGIPVLLKDNINTADKMHTSAGSIALSRSYALKDAHIVKLLRKAGAVILGKTNMTEFGHFMDQRMPGGYSSRGGIVKNPYGEEFQTSGSSSGSAVAVAANLCMASIGTETSGSILSPAYHNSLVGIKPTIGLISRSGIVPITHTQDTPGPLARTVEDAAILLDFLVGQDEADFATLLRSKRGSSYVAHLDPNGLKGARIGINRGYEADFNDEQKDLFEQSIRALEKAGAIVVEGTNLPHLSTDKKVLLYEFKSAINKYLADLGPENEMKSLRHIIAYNNKHHEKALKYGQEWLIKAEFETTGTMTEPEYIEARLRDWRKARNGIDQLLRDHELDALFSPGVTDSPALSGYPSIMTPAGYTRKGMPFGVCFTGTAFSESALVKLAFSFQEITKQRKAPEL
ncbi:amidase family protein [Bacillus sp. JCM 19034]|uniref:amidase family protein n=1 Tax=Bacillus sp. JCM 19034 TaxID=1481928 RepID=UPI0009E712A2|nr:amidase family protein [Bacillus sp. JCM 19034]